jgi:Transposase DDE domain
MERESWLEISQVLSQIACRWQESKVYQHPTALIVRVYLWAVAHDRPVSWACDPYNWEKPHRPPALPSQSTMSRRMREHGRYGSDDFWQMMMAVGKRLAGKASSQLVKVRRIDGKPLEVAGHSKDHNAKWGRGAGKKARGYKLHAIWSNSPMPDQWCLTPLNVSEKQMGHRLIKRLSLNGNSCGYLMGDGYYDDSRLHDTAATVNHQLLVPRQHPNSGLGHHYQSPCRLRAINMLEVPANIDPFGRELYCQRKQIERDFGNLCGYGGGLMSMLPPWVRRPWRVRSWGHAKLLLNAARIRCLQRRKATAPA